MEGLTKVYLHGKLGALFGHEWNLAVNSPTEAIRAIDTNLKGKLRAYLTGPGARRFYKVALQNKGNVIEAAEISHRSGRSDIHIIPTIRGGNAVARIIVGIVLIVVSIYTYNLGGAWEGVGMIIGGVGASLVIGGVTEMLTPIPKPREETEQKQSSNFQGNATAAYQGAPVPLVYGRMLVSPIPICISQSAHRSSTITTTTNIVGNIEQIPLAGGGYMYQPIYQTVRPPINDDYHWVPEDID